MNDDIALDAKIWLDTLDTNDALPGLETQADKEAMDDLITQGRNARKRSHFHASAVLKRPVDYYKQPLYCDRECVLAQFYQTNEVVHLPKTQMIFDNGWDVHVRWQEMFKRSGVLRLAEVPFFSMQYHMQFTPDAIIDFRGKQRIVEIKGYNQRAFVKLLKGGIPEDAYLQCQLYLHLYKTFGNKRLDDGLIIVECKDTQEYIMWSITRNESNVKYILDRLDTINVLAQNHKETGDLPSGVCDNKSCPRAQACSMREACFLSNINRETMRLERSVPVDATVI